MKKILIVDDNATLAYFAARNLQREIRGVQVMTAASCRQAKVQSENDPPTLVITDLKLPDGDGLDLIRELSQDSATMRAIVTSANALPPGEEVVIFGSLAKPYEIDILVDLVRQAMASEENHNGKASDDLDPAGLRKQRAYDPHRIQNRLAGLLAGLRACQGDLIADAENAVAIRRHATDQIDRFCNLTLEIAGIIKEESAGSEGE